MRIIGRDYILKILNQQYLQSVFEVRKKYFSSGEPKELGKNSTIFFAMKNPETHDYELIGQARPIFVGPFIPRDKDEDNFSEEHNWRFVIELVDLCKYPKPIRATDVFTIDTVKKLHTQRPYGIELSVEESRSAKMKILAISGTSIQS